MSDLFIAAQTAPPLPDSPSEIGRIRHSRLRRRILYGYHEQDVLERVRAAVGTTRQQKWGAPDLTSNPLVTTYSQLAGLHRKLPVVTPPSGGGADVLAAAADGGLFSLLPRLERDVLAMREGLVRVDVKQEEGGDLTAHFRPVFADLCEVDFDPWTPDQPVAVREWIPDPDDKSKWVRLITDVRSSEYLAVDATGADVTARVLGGEQSGASYPFVGETTGRPRMPYIAYHAAQTGTFWDPYTGREVVDGVLSLCVLYTFYQHVVRNSAWMQRFIFGAQPQGLAESEEGARSHEVVTDPATALLLEPLEGVEPGTQPLIGQWGLPVDPEKLLNSIILYERRLVGNASGSPDVTRAEADIRSGYSLAVGMQAQQDAMQAFEPMFRRSDVLVLSTLADLMGGPVDGWRIAYRALDQSPQQQAAETDRIVRLVEAGLMSRTEARMKLHPELSEEAAAAWVAANPLPGDGDGG